MPRKRDSHSYILSDTLNCIMLCQPIDKSYEDLATPAPPRKQSGIIMPCASRHAMPLVIQSPPNALYAAQVTIKVSLLSLHNS
jgi:hypothetical protein